MLKGLPLDFWTHVFFDTCVVLHAERTAACFLDTCILVNAIYVTASHY
jgi:hypothetical protein